MGRKRKKMKNKNSCAADQPAVRPPLRNVCLSVCLSIFVQRGRASASDALQRVATKQNCSKKVRMCEIGFDGHHTGVCVGVRLCVCVCIYYSWAIFSIKLKWLHPTRCVMKKSPSSIQLLHQAKRLVANFHRQQSVRLWQMCSVEAGVWGWSLYWITSDESLHCRVGGSS